MSSPKKLIRNAHFLGVKIRNLRKNNKLTMEDLSARCIKIDPEAAPSVSYISMIERGKRTPGRAMLAVIASVFQKDPDWFLDDMPVDDGLVPDKGGRGGISGMALEPGFLFSSEILQIAIPEMLSQTGTSGRQFAHLLIRAHQEAHQNQFPDLERAAEGIGNKQMPLSLQALEEITKSLGLKVKWFDELSERQMAELGVSNSSVVRSFFEAPNKIHLNTTLRAQAVRKKYDLAVYIGHKILHDGDGVKSAMLTGKHYVSGIREATTNINQKSAVDAKDIMLAWRDFECSFFAAALLCPKVPFRRLLERNGYEVNSGVLVDVSHSIAMRRMTSVSPYPHWHYFDAYPPGRLNAVYRGNGIPLPWGNMRMVQDPCQHWAVFRKLNEEPTGSSAQISLLDVGGESRIYACESVTVEDLAGTQQVLCAGVDLNPALAAQGEDPLNLAADLKKACGGNGGSAAIPAAIKKELVRTAKILNIAWVERGIENDARVICPRSSACPRQPVCHKDQVTLS